jgi:hypothetical protein
MGFLVGVVKRQVGLPAERSVPRTLRAIPLGASHMPHLRGIEEGSFDAIGFILASECGNVVINLALRDVSGYRVNSSD